MTAPEIRLSRSLCAVIGNALSKFGSHPSLELLFKTSGIPGDPPALAHHSKWKTWLFEAGNNPGVDILKVLGNILEEFMDLKPNLDEEQIRVWEEEKVKIITCLEESGLRYYRGGRVLPFNVAPPTDANNPSVKVEKPSTVQEVIQTLIRGLPRAIQPLIHRRKEAQSLSFTNEYDLQDMLHALLRPWIADIRPEEFTPSYAGSSTRMDFLLPEHSIVIEMKFVRDRAHGRKISDELIIDIEHYRRHPDCKTLWCVIYDPNNFIPNQEGLKKDLDGSRMTSDSEVVVKTFIISI